MDQRNRKNTPRIYKNLKTNTSNYRKRPVSINNRKTRTSRKPRSSRISKSLYNTSTTCDIIKVAQIIIVLLMIFCIYSIINWKLSSNTNKELISQIQKDVSVSYVDFNGETIEIVENEFDSYNSSVKAWIKINNTDVNYPIVQGTNNGYYLNHNLNGEKNKAGWIFADYRNDLTDLDKNTIIYGHNMSDNTMFAGLEKTLDTAWCKENKNFIFNTLDKKYVAEIVSVYKIKATDFIVKNTFTENEFLNYVDEIKAKSVYDFDVQVFGNDKLVTLYTCDDNNVNRIIVQAKLVEV